MQEAVAYDKPAAALAGFYEDELTRALQRFHEELTAPVAEKLRVARVQLLRIRGGSPSEDGWCSNSLRRFAARSQRRKWQSCLPGQPVRGRKRP
ncbi:MAG: hypothetical protein LAT75_13330 [Candidatus Cyclonatronum sp.]|uniref:hypothetical protein n=1 Tax=Cyclonatronum sp. TaxID=3024185 RepID=UPI0025C1ACF9|nr:hypothetical protein [Cyclonatronum sp.]MCH8487845.1 hypothetical protein [Cyclonatronum sp.]